MLMLGSIAPVISLRNSRKRLLLKLSSFIFIRPFLPWDIYGSLPLPLMLLRTTAKKKTLFAGIHIYSRGIAAVSSSGACIQSQSKWRRRARSTRNWGRASEGSREGERRASLEGIENEPRLQTLGSFSNDHGGGRDNALWKMNLYFTFKCRNCVNLFSTSIGLKTCSG